MSALATALDADLLADDHSAQQPVLLSYDQSPEVAGWLVTVTAGGISVRLPTASADALTASRPGALSVGLGGHVEQLADVALARRIELGDETIVELQVRDAASCARLWDVWDRQRGGAAQIVPGHADSGSIPARGHYTEAARVERLQWIRRVSGAPLETLEQSHLDVAGLRGNIENLVGSIEIPVGLAGPLLFNGSNVQGMITAPLATTEGTLVASTTRGARAISRAGGVTTQILGQRMSRAPMYEFDDVRAAARFGRWLQSQHALISEQISQVSRHARLVEVWPIQIGRVVHVRFSYETADAAGQNMTTACTWRACQWINEMACQVAGLTPRQFFVEGNASGDKKVSYLSIIAGRGTRVTAECFLDRGSVEEVLKTTPQAIASVSRFAVQSSMHAGMVGNSINPANLVAAIFAATGQDIGCVHESSVALLSIDAVDDGLYASILLPALIVGTVGGGTQLAGQRDLLDMIGCVGSGGVPRLAEIIAGFALALDLSTIAAVTGGQFADAHERLGRNRPVHWFTRQDLTEEFFTPMLAHALDAPALQVTSVSELAPVRGSSIISEVTSGDVAGKLVGLLRLRLQYTTAGEQAALDVVAKVKPLDSEVILATSKVASLCGGRLAELYAQWRDSTGFSGVHTRELGIYRGAEQRLRDVMPRVYGLHECPQREAYVIVLEDLAADAVLMDSAGERDRWTEQHVDAALGGIARVHAIWLGRPDELAAQPWLGHHLGSQQMVAMEELWLALAEHNAVEYPTWIDAFTLVRIKNSLAELGEWWPELEAMPRTLVHNDFNPRNIVLRTEGLRLAAYDWELATIHVPQRDLAELLAFTLPADVHPDRVAHHLDTHRCALEQAAGVELDPHLWRRGYRLALRDFTLTRLQLYLIAHTQRRYEFLDDLVATVKRLIAIEAEHDIAQGRYSAEAATHAL